MFNIKLSYVSLINAAIKRQLEFKDELCIRNMLGDETFLRERRTIVMDFGRCTGKTPSIIEFLTLNQDSILIVMNNANLRWITNKYPEVAERIMTYSKFKQISETITTDYVLVDEPKFSVDNELYNYCAKCRAKHVIMLGAIKL